MARKILLTVVSMLCIVMLFTSCSDKSKKEGNVDEGGNIPSHVGMYTQYKSSILLRNNGTFITILEEGNSSKMEFTGNYSLSDEEITFNIKKMNGEEMTNTLMGTLKDDVITYEGGKPFYKDKEYVLTLDDKKAKEEPRAVVPASSGTPVPSADSSSSNTENNDEN